MKTLIIEDHPLYADALQRELERSGCFPVVHVSRTLSDALTTGVASGPELVVADLTLTDASGVEVCVRMREALPGAVLVAVSASTEKEVVSAAVAAGAIGYLSKTVEPDELIHSLIDACNGRLVFDPAVSAHITSMLRREVELSAPAQQASQDSVLSQREIDVLELYDHGFTTAEVAARLHLAVATVKSHVQRASLKLGTTSRGSAIAAARRSGLLRSSVHPN